MSHTVRDARSTRRRATDLLPVSDERDSGPEPGLPSSAVPVSGLLWREAADGDPSDRDPEDTPAPDRASVAHRALAAIRRRTVGPEEVETARREARRDPGAPLPYLDRMQSAFGRHSLAGIQAHTGTAAGAAAVSLNARAFTAGDHIAFAGQPDLATVAHEAAHVIQQRQGVSVPGGLGARGDAHERQAHAVAAAVVQGRSAEPLLAGFGGSGSNLSAAVQLFDDDEITDLKDMIAMWMNQSGIDLQTKEINAKIAALDLLTPRNKMRSTKESLRKWFAELEAAKPQVVAKPQPVVQPSTERKEPKDQDAQDALLFGGKEKKKKNPSNKEQGSNGYVPLDLTNVKAAPKLGFGTAGALGATKADPVDNTPKTNAKAASLATKFAAFQPSKGHGGINAVDMTGDDLFAMIGLIKPDRLKNYYILLGAGTGDWSQKLQLKLVHYQVLDKASNKKATYHITVSPGAFAELAATYDEKDGYEK